MGLGPQYMLWVADPGTWVYPGYTHGSTQTHRPWVRFSRVWVWVDLTYPGVYPGDALICRQDQTAGP